MIKLLIKTINAEYGKTIIQVTHSKEAASYGSRVLHLKDGEIVRDQLTA